MSQIIKFSIVVALALGYSCKSKSKQPETSVTKSGPISDNKKNYLINFNSESLYKSNRIFVKIAGNNDDGAVYLVPDSSSIGFIFGLNRCEYSFPCINEVNKIKLKWNLDHSSCTYKNSLSENSGLKSHPKKNDIFAEIEPQGDSALKITYLFKEFINEQNQKGRENKEFKIDTLFPVIFKCSNCRQ